jgi:AraC family transcriptional regulator
LVRGKSRGGKGFPVGSDGAVGLSESLGDGYLTSRELKVFGEGGSVVEVARHRFLAGEVECPPLAGHALVVHLGGPNRLSARVGGRVRERIEGRGDVTVYPARSPIWFAGEASEDVNVLLGSGFVRRVAEESGADPGGFEVLDRFCERDEPMERLMLSFLPELESGGLGGELYGESLASALAVHLLREHSSLGEKAKRRVARKPKPGGLSKRALRAATDYVGDNLASGLSLEEIAKAANLSPYHFARLFKESTGLSPHQYVIRERVERAKGLLRGTDLPVGEIARACGFSHHQHLARHFSRLTGTSPTRFRAEASR